MARSALRGTFVKREHLPSYKDLLYFSQLFTHEGVLPLNISISSFWCLLRSELCKADLWCILCSQNQTSNVVSFKYCSNFTHILHHEFGNCFVFNSHWNDDDTLTIHKSGSLYGNNYLHIFISS